MRGFMTKDKRYYETENGKVNESDLEVPIRPSENHTFDDTWNLWEAPHGDRRIEPRDFVFGVRDVITIIAVVASTAGLYYGITGKMETTTIELRSEIKLQSVQIQNVKESVDDLKKRLEIHETRSFAKEGVIR